MYADKRIWLCGQGQQAVAEFQKLIDHRAILQNSPLSSLAHLQLGRAYAMQGDTVKAKAAYQDFLTIWKDADPNIPVFIAAKAEYANIQ
jgi:tetratricopeptide (TPR) repeat protein